MSNSPQHVLSRLLHREDNPIRLWPKYDRDLLEDKIKEHISKCKHPRCIEKKNKLEDLTLALLYATNLKGKDT